jgi:hypothetical protein
VSVMKNVLDYGQVMTGTNSDIGMCIKPRHSDAF